MFTYLKIAAVAVPLIAAAVLFGLWRSATGDLKVAKDAVIQRDAQIATLVEARKAQDQLDAWAEDDRKAMAAQIIDLMGNVGGVRTVFVTPKAKVINVKPEDDGPASPVLVGAADDLRRLYVAKVMPACDRHEDGAATVPSPARTPDCDAVGALIPIPTRQSEFAAIALRFAQAYLQDVEKIHGALAVLDKHNADIDAFNAKANGSTMPSR